MRNMEGFLAQGGTEVGRYMYVFAHKLIPWATKVPDAYLALSKYLQIVKWLVMHADNIGTGIAQHLKDFWSYSECFNITQYTIIHFHDSTVQMGQFTPKVAVMLLEHKNTKTFPLGSLDGADAGWEGVQRDLQLIHSLGPVLISSSTTLSKRLTIWCRYINRCVPKSPPWVMMALEPLSWRILVKNYEEIQ